MSDGDAVEQRLRDAILRAAPWTKKREQNLDAYRDYIAAKGAERVHDAESLLRYMRAHSGSSSYWRARIDRHFATYEAALAGQGGQTDG